MANFDVVIQKSEVIIAAVKAKLATIGTKIPLSAGWRIIQESVGSVVLLIEQQIGDGLSGPDKKAAALAVVGNIIDLVTVAVDIPYVPEVAESVIDSVLKKILLAIASGSIDAIVSTFKSTGIFPTKGEVTN